MKNQPDNESGDVPSWGGGPQIQAEDTVEDGKPGLTGNAVGQGSCAECEIT